MLRVAGSLRSRQSGSPEGSCAGGATWHFSTSSNNLAGRLAYLDCISTAWGVFVCMLHSSKQVQKLVINGSTLCINVYSLVVHGICLFLKDTHHTLQKLKSK